MRIGIHNTALFYVFVALCLDRLCPNVKFYPISGNFCAGLELMSQSVDANMLRQNLNERYSTVYQKSTNSV
jgi:hypothetical protein